MGDVSVDRGTGKSYVMKIYIVIKVLTRADGEKVTSIYEKAFTDKELANKVSQEAETSLPRYKIYDVEIRELELVDEA